jgi:hypothetical protein
MPAPSLLCPECRTPLPFEQVNTGGLTPCPGCGKPTRIEMFPALLRPVRTGATAETILVDGEAGCFYHPQKRAAVHCQGCGRFLCALCDVELNGQHLCPGCLETNQRKGKLSELESQRTLYDNAALSLATLPLLIWPFTIVTAPTAIGVAIYGWNKPGSMVARTRLRAVLAILIGLLELAGWGFFGYALITAT